MLATPAKWKVFRVICVPGSPILWAANAPTAVPEEQTLHFVSNVAKSVYFVFLTFNSQENII